MRTFLWWISLVVAVAGLYAARWQPSRLPEQRDGLINGIGHVEAKEFDIVVPHEGVLEHLLVRPGDTVAAGQVIARMDTHQLEVRLREVGSDLLQARTFVEGAHIQLNYWLQGKKASSRQSLPQPVGGGGTDASRQHAEKMASSLDEAVVRHPGDARLPATASEQRLHDINHARTNKAVRETTVMRMRSQLFEAQARVIALETVIGRLQAAIDACALRAPGPGRVLQRYAKDGDGMTRGSRVLRLLDLREVTLAFSLPAHAAHRLTIGAEARLVLDLPTPTVFPAQIASIAAHAHQCTGAVCSVHHQPDVAVKAKIAPEVLKFYAGESIGGLTGTVYARPDPDSPWPEALRVDYQAMLGANNKLRHIFQNNSKR